MPARWQLGRIRGKPEAASVLLLAEVPGRDVWEVVYLGLTPAARGQGLGRAVLRHALELAGQACPSARASRRLPEHPATRLYHSAGFVVRDRRAVHWQSSVHLRVGRRPREERRACSRRPDTHRLQGITRGPPPLA